METDFGQWLRAERARLDLSQQQVAELAHLAVGTISLIERDGVKARRTTKAHVREALLRYEDLSRGGHSLLADRGQISSAGPAEQRKQKGTA